MVDSVGALATSNTMVRMLTARRVMAACALAAALWLPPPARAADPVAGATKAASCRSCHGADGNSPFDGIPSLAAQPAPYIKAQIVLYREKKRQIPEMNAAVADLTDADVADIAAYFAEQKPTEPPADTDHARLVRGRALAEARNCQACHQANFVGRDKVARLAGQREDYLLKAMHDFKSGARVGTDVVMPGKMQGTSEQEMADLAYFFAHTR
ncbi:MAG: cytochrome c4 [Alphaproteobacteria bacterium]|nr:cytochrome c4 [Alphaproteobacteria bacterium]